MLSAVRLIAVGCTVAVDVSEAVVSGLSPPVIVTVTV